jgi:RNA polymerase sigma-70 factor (ECF subfamily)
MNPSAAEVLLRNTKVDSEEKTDEICASREGEILERYLEGQEDALGVLFKRHEGRIYAFCRKMLWTHEDAEDALQEVFFRLARRPSFKNERFLAWLYRIALNVCRSHIRSHRSRIRRETESAERTPAESTPTPAHILAEHLEEERISRALGQLPRRHREVVLLKYIEDFKTPEVAEILGLPLTTIEGRLRRARKKLRRILARSHPS